MVVKYMRFVTGDDDELWLLPELPENHIDLDESGPILRRKVH
jgi:hypothetical protein